MKMVDADKLHYHKVIINAMNWTHKEAVVVFAKEIDKAEIVDAVPVVRCNDCRSAHKGGSGYIWCKGVPHPLDWFCADGKPNDVEESYTCGATGLPCIKCNPGGCNSRRKDGDE